MTITVEELRRKYPNPQVPDISVSVTAYCVGGTLACELGVARGWMQWFPSPNVGDRNRPSLRELLRTANPSLDEDEALLIAQHITEENDEGNFEDAWAWMSKGLTA